MHENELTWRQRGRLWLRLGLRFVLWLALALGCWKLLPPVLSLFGPFVAAAVLAWLLNPVIRFLQKKLNLGRGVLSLVLMLLALAVVGGLLAGLFYTLAAQVISFLQNWRSAWNAFLSTMGTVSTTLDDLLGPLYHSGEHPQAAQVVQKATAWLSGTVPRLLANAAGSAGSFALSLPSLALAVVIFVMATYFISADYPHLRFKAAQKVPEELRDFCSLVKRIAVDAFGGYVRAQFILSVVVFFILLAGFLILGESYGLLLAFLLAVMDFIPIIGAGTVMVPWAVVDVVLGNFRHALGLMVVWGIIVVFRRLAEPKIVGNQTGLSPIVSLISIYVGMRLGGVVGMVLGPVLCLIALNMGREGVFDGTARDLRLALRDLNAIFRNGGQDGL